MSTLTIQKGRILIYRLFDVAQEINLSLVEKKAASSKRLRLSKLPHTKAIEFTNPPVSFELPPYTTGIFDEELTVTVLARAYDFGVMSIVFDIPIPENTTFARLEEVSKSLDMNAELEAKARLYVHQAVDGLGPNVINREIKENLVEDYMIFYLEALGKDLTADELLEQYDPSKLLLYETRKISPSTRNETLKHSFSYFPNDLIIIHIDNAFIIEPTGSFDLPDLLEFANAQIFEMRYYDNLIDKHMQAIYSELSKGGLSYFSLRRYERFAKKISRTITDITEVTEKIDNSLKVTKDVYYARIYRRFMDLSRSMDWEASIKGKLQIIMNTNKMLYDEILAKRAYILELSIVILIAIEIVLILMGKM